MIQYLEKRHFAVQFLPWSLCKRTCDDFRKATLITSYLQRLFKTPLFFENRNDEVWPENLLKALFYVQFQFARLLLMLSLHDRNHPHRLLIKAKIGGCDALSDVEARFLTMNCVELYNLKKWNLLNSSVKCNLLFLQI